MDSVYHLIINIGILLSTPFLLVKMGFDRSFRKDIMGRFFTHRKLLVQKGCIWIHASSVGEVRAANILIQGMKALGMLKPIVLSTFTLTGYELARKEGLDPVFRLPPDTAFFLNPLLDKIDPAILILVEAEFWPGLLRLCQKRAIPVFLTNGRISKGSLERYQKIKPIFHWLTEAIRVFSMRSRTDANRLVKLGTTRSKIVTTGNIKFDAKAIDNKDIVPVEERPANIVFGSTRPGDEGPVMEAIVELRKDFPDLDCVIAPRHIERCKEVEGLIKDFGLDYQLFSGLKETPDAGKGSLVLMDQLGYLNDCYAKSTIAFVGGGFNPRFGGHNILEPALAGVPVIFGPHMNNFQEEADLLIESSGGIQIDDPGELSATLKSLLDDDEERIRLGKLAKEIVEENRGALTANIDLIQKILRNAEGELC
jgi:3-deoxy-D-manno-octulosonic-acid transferase